jgi:signal peptide peptidase SppA
MKPLDILTAPWAIVPEKYNEIQEIYFTHLRGEKIDIKGIEARLGRKLENQEQGYENINGVGVVPINGVIAKKMNMFSEISGGASTQLVERDFRGAMNDTQVKAILLDIDSPGGAVDGTQDLANVIYEARGKKPICAFTDGIMASAAYWIGSAADKIFISGDTTQVGSIGVVASHVDISKAEESRGVKTTEIVAGKYKRIASRYSPLSEEGKATLQEMVDYLYRVFVEDVAKFRGTTEQRVLGMADGKVFIGKQALRAGLVDGVSSLSNVIEKLSQGKPVEGAGAALDTMRKRSEDREGKKKQLVDEYLEAHPQSTLKDAILTVAKSHPDLFRWGSA